MATISTNTIDFEIADAQQRLDKLNQLKALQDAAKAAAVLPAGIDPTWKPLFRFVNGNFVVVAWVAPGFISNSGGVVVL